MSSLANKRIRKKKQPTLFAKPKQTLDKMKKVTMAELQAQVAKDMAEYGYDVKVTPKYVIATEARMRKQGVIDLKYGFSKSSKKKYAKDGSWYVVVPIKRSARSFKPSTVYKNANKANKMLDAGKKATVKIKGLAKSINDQAPTTLSSLQYKAKSDNLTLQKNKTGKRTSYTAYRTVSSKSPANSWIINKSKLNESSTSKTFQKDIERTMAWKMRSIGGREK